MMQELNSKAAKEKNMDLKDNEARQKELRETVDSKNFDLEQADY